MNITCVLGSPRTNGNSATLTRYMLQQFEQRGANVQAFEINKLNYRGCQGCMACKTTLETCGLRDDITPILERVKNSDVLIVASGVYYGNVTSQAKAFLDRIYSFYVPEFYLKDESQRSRLTPGKKLIFVLTQGNSDESLFADIYSSYERLIRIHGFQQNYQLRACGISSPADIQARPELFAQVDAIVNDICGAA